MYRRWRQIRWHGEFNFFRFWTRPRSGFARSLELNLWDCRKSIEYSHISRIENRRWDVRGLEFGVASAYQKVVLERIFTLRKLANTANPGEDLTTPPIWRWRSTHMRLHSYGNALSIHQMSFVTVCGYEVELLAKRYQYTFMLSLQTNC